MEDQQKLVTAIKTITESCWADRQSPILLSVLPGLLEDKVPDFRTALGSRTLKAFIKETEQFGGYKLVEHPIQRARVGVVPAGADYKFPSEMDHSSMTIAKGSHQEATLAFFRALATLPSEDLEKVIIPASVLVKLLK